MEIFWGQVLLARLLCITNQPSLSSIIKSRRLTFFGHLSQMDEKADASQASFEPPPENWRRPPGRPRWTWMSNVHDDRSSLDLGIHEARDLAQNRPLWETDVFAQCYALVAVHATIGLKALLLLLLISTAANHVKVMKGCVLKNLITQIKTLPASTSSRCFIASQLTKKSVINVIEDDGTLHDCMHSYLAVC